MLAAAVLRERLPSAVEVLRLDRPDQRNALDTALLRSLLDALAELAEDEQLRALVLSSTSTAAFSAGADVREPLDEAGGVARMELFCELYGALAVFPAPTICVCVGNVVGAGAEIAAGCDLRVAGDNLRLSWVGARLGIPVGPARLVPLVGESRARELLLTGRTLGAEDAASLGLLAAPPVAPERAEDAAVELAATLPAGARRIKALLRELDGRPPLERIGRENAGLLVWQSTGAGLPSG